MGTRPTTRRLGRGDLVATRNLTTIHDIRVAVPDPSAVVHLQFRRFAACPICNVHLRRVLPRHDEIEAAGVREVVVFHSDASAMLPHQGDLPFTTIADPERTLYDEFGVMSSPAAFLNPAAWTAPFKPEAWRTAAREWRDPGSRPFHIRGNSMAGLPAEFLIGSDGMVRAAKYGRHANDQWTVDELLSIVAATATDSR